MGAAKKNHHFPVWQRFGAYFRGLKNSLFFNMAVIWGTFSGAKELTIFNMAVIWGTFWGAKGLTIFQYGSDLRNISGG